MNGALESKLDGFGDGVDADVALEFSIVRCDATTIFKWYDVGLADVAGVV
jgi:hypothetical protein